MFLYHYGCFLQETHEWEACMARHGTSVLPVTESDSSGDLGHSDSDAQLVEVS
jgi:hypothetical protein